jgi:8-oxo-dGTP pyrophosphatase MutT (NUDIX family)
MATPVKRRCGRVIAIDRDGRVLLLAGQHEGRRIWITPGGGCWPDEDDVTTACREFFEETGMRLEPPSLGHVVATTTGEWTAPEGTLYATRDAYFAVRVEAFTPVTDGHEPLERDWIEEFRWWSLAELEATHETVWPLGLAPLIRRLVANDWPAEPIALPWHHDEP